MNEEDDQLSKTTKISIADIKKLQIQTECSPSRDGLEISVALGRDVLNRVEALVDNFSKKTPTHFNALTSEIFMEGLKVLEDRHK